MKSEWQRMTVNLNNANILTMSKLIMVLPMQSFASFQEMFHTRYLHVGSIIYSISMYYKFCHLIEVYLTYSFLF